MYKIISTLKFNLVNEGFGLTISKAKNKIKKYIYDSRTLYFYEKHLHDLSEENLYINPSYKVVMLSLPSDLDNFSNKDIFFNIPLESWIKNDSNCIMIVDATRIVAYGWFHKKTYKLDTGKIDFSGEDKCWLGPMYVNHRYRRQGINSFLYNEIHKKAAALGIKSIISSANSENYPSIKTFEKFSYIRIRSAKNIYKFGRIIH